MRTASTFGGTIIALIGLVPGLLATAVAQPKTPVRLSVSSSGDQGNGDSRLLGTSRDSRYVLFRSLASNLVSGDTNGVEDLFVRDRDVDRNGIFDEPGRVATIRISVGTHGEQADRSVGNGIISPDGRFVLFTTDASTLVPGDTNGAADVFLRDRDVDGNGIFDEPEGVRTTRISEGTGGIQADAASTAISMTPDGRFVLFSSAAASLSSQPVNGVVQIYRKDRQTGVLTLVTRTAAGAPADQPSRDGSMSDDGQIVAFDSYASNLGSIQMETRIYVRDFRTDAMVTVAPPTSFPYPFETVFASPGVSPEGETVFVSARTLSPGTGGSFSASGKLFEFDRRTGAIRLVTIGTEFRFAVNRRFIIGSSTFGRLLLCQSSGGLSAYDRNTGRTVFLTNAGYTDIAVSASLRRMLFMQLPPLSACGSPPGSTTLQPSSLVDTAYGTPVTMPAPVRTGAMNEDGSEVIIDAAEDDILPPGVDTNGARDVFAVDLNSRLDQDGDGLDDRWEAATGLSYTSGIGADGPGGDPDGDGVTNLEEFQRGTHPRGTVFRYLAEGAQNAFFSTRLAFVNPGSMPATTVVRVLGETGEAATAFVPVPTSGRRTLDLRDVPNAPSSFSIIVESDQPVVVERTMSWDASSYGGHSEHAVAPSTTWFLAEGSTTGEFSLFYLLQNPNANTATATIRYLRPDGLSPIERTHALPPMSRMTIPVNTELSAFASTDLSAAITADQPIVAERAMYLTRFGQPFAAGTASAGVTAPATTWYFAEGATGPFFDMFLLIANPTVDDAVVDARYLLPGGDVLTKTYTVAANSRLTIWVNGEDIAGRGLALAHVDVSTTLQSANGVPFVAERVMWFPSPAITNKFWTEAHSSSGSTVTATRWAFAEGEEGGPANTRTFVLVANTSSFASLCRVTLRFEDGSTTWTAFIVSPNSRLTVPIGDAFPTAAARRFGIVVESIDHDFQLAQLVVERSIYWDAAGVTWAAGTNVVGTPIP